MTRPIPLRRGPVLAALRRLEPELRAGGIEKLYLFGSVARDEAEEGSDIDVFCDLPADTGMDAFAFIGLRHKIEDELLRPIDMTTRRGLHRLIREEIVRSAVQVF